MNSVGQTVNFKINLMTYLNSCQKLFVRYQLNTKEGKNQIEQILENRGCFK